MSQDILYPLIRSIRSARLTEGERDGLNQGLQLIIQEHAKEINALKKEISLLSKNSPQPGN